MLLTNEPKLSLMLPNIHRTRGLGLPSLLISAGDPMAHNQLFMTKPAFHETENSGEYAMKQLHSLQESNVFSAANFDITSVERPANENVNTPGKYSSRAINKKGDADDDYNILGMDPMHSKK